MATGTPLEKISPRKIVKNPDNPRLIFHEDEMNYLLGSISTVGIKVPLAVYKDGAKYVLLDGERRWRCATKLNLSEVPALVQPKPSRLENLLMMFNIHNVRVDWDPLPMALKLKDIHDILASQNGDTSVKNISAITGVKPTAVKRAFEIIELPQKYKDILMKESLKPRKDQRIKVDLFLEIFKSYSVIEKNTPEVLNHISKKQYVESMVGKYESGVVDNVVHYREVSKIAKSERAGIDRKESVRVLVKLVNDKGYGIQEAYKDTVELAYQKLGLTKKAKDIIEIIAKIKSTKGLDDETLATLRELYDSVGRLLRG
jgi:ParB family chromosome partitioning protein